MSTKTPRRKPTPIPHSGDAAAETTGPKAFAADVAAVDPAPQSVDEGCPIIYADMICLGASRLGKVRVAFFTAADPAHGS